VLRPGFDALRDTAIIRLPASSRARSAEVAGLRTFDLMQDELSAIVTGKGRRQRIIRYDAAAGVGLHRYLRAHGKHRAAGSDALRIGKAGPMTGDGIYQLVKRRAREAGIQMNPHRFRHDFSHRRLPARGQETDLMAQNGWSSASKVRRYGASAAADRAPRALRRGLGPEVHGLTELRRHRRRCGPDGLVDSAKGVTRALPRLW